MNTTLRISRRFFFATPDLSYCQNIYTDVVSVPERMVYEKLTVPSWSRMRR
ncbi:hypothetical protein KsCSTR_21010 [Candidatus Kuenenia stuttgartiensis]|uniref:Uncharacterized protein n=1 Tax=Kuenenia stuttgartiensis TaxID=174633 RepID=Q1Q2Y8_KUEST|nr:hypothetical protein KsCSTR_21010 [Candidatus Kuenenia stuttgartiensis]CAJ74374.1 unknown protein [Candidatus Kuenenia stuttgartiensis]